MRNNLYILFSKKERNTKCLNKHFVLRSFLNTLFSFQCINILLVKQ